MTYASPDPIQPSSTPRPGELARAVVVVGGGPAGLMAAEVARSGGAEVHVFEAKGSVGRKFLVAGKGGLNLTHADPFERFVSRFAPDPAWCADWLHAFDADALRAWARELGVETFVGTSGRVFPLDLRAAPLLRGWVRRLRQQGVHFHVHHRWTGWNADGSLSFESLHGPRTVQAGACVLACGGASWPELGADGNWVPILRDARVSVADLLPANCGFEVQWSPQLVARHAGSPVKPVHASFVDAAGVRHEREGEFVLTEYGVEGSLIYALSSGLRDTIAAQGQVVVDLDLAPDRSHAQLAAALAAAAKRRSLGERLRRAAGVHGARAALLFEALPAAMRDDSNALAARIKSSPLVLLRPRPIAEAISSAGGVRRDALDDTLMLRTRPGVFCAGEMLDWEAPTGGYLLTACFASGRMAGHAARRWLESS